MRKRDDLNSGECILPSDATRRLTPNEVRTVVWVLKPKPKKTRVGVRVMNYFYS